MTENEEKDINDVFDDLLFIEEKSVESGYQEGYLAGKSEDNPEGFHLGYHRGAEIGAELGYYSAIVKQLLKSGNHSEKVQKSLNDLDELITNFPKENNESDILKLFDDIRTKYKKVCAQLKLSAAFPEVDNLSF